MVGVLIFFKKTEVRYGWGFILLKMLKEGMAKVLLGYYLVQKAKNLYSWGFAQIRHCLGFLLLNMLK